jgi:hypothetical protein
MNKFWTCPDCGDDALIPGPNALLRHQAECAGFTTCPVHNMRHRKTEACPFGAMPYVICTSAPETFFTAEELASASVCGPTELPDCVPGGCGGLTVDAGCSVCSGDCAGANPPVYACPMRDSSAKTVDTSLGGQRVEALQLDAETLFNVYAMADGNTMDGMRAVAAYVRDQVDYLKRQIAGAIVVTDRPDVNCSIEWPDAGFDPVTGTPRAALTAALSKGETP